MIKQIRQIRYKMIMFYDFSLSLGLFPHPFGSRREGRANASSGRKGKGHGGQRKESDFLPLPFL